MVTAEIAWNLNYLYLLLSSLKVEYLYIWIYIKIISEIREMNTNKKENLMHSKL